MATHLPSPARLAVLASGGGTNLQALLDHADRLGASRGWEIVVVASDRAAAGALARARARGIATALLATEKRQPPDGVPVGVLLEKHRVDLVVLAGYLRLVPPEVVRHYASRMLNVHPALLPAFGGPGMYGQRVHQAVLDAGATVTGVTVHLVSEEYDRGAIVAQWPVPVLAGDDAAMLAARVLRVEHLFFPRVVDAVARGGLAAARARPDSAPPRPGDAATFTRRDADDAALAESIELALDQ